MPDSFEQLALSIERVVRGDLPARAAAQQLSTAIDRIMRAESRAGELRIADLRVLLIAPFAVLALVSLVRPGGIDPLSLSSTATRIAAVLTTTWLALAVVLARALRRGWYRRWVPHVIPALDAAMIAAGFLVPLLLSGRSGPVPAEALASLTILCAFLSISGGLRLSRTSARASTALAVAAFIIAAAGVRLDPVATAVIGMALVSTGLLSGSVMHLVRRVVTDDVANATLSSLYADARREVEAREQVLKVVSHELRDPIGTINMAAGLLIELDLPREQQLRELDRIKRTGAHLKRLVHDLLDVAKLEAGRVAIAPREIAVEPLMREAYEMLAPLAATKDIVLELDLADELPPVTADAGRIVQVLSNLVGNGVKFTPEGGRIVMSARPIPGGVQFSVRDTGPGIDPAQLPRIFSRFWQADATDRRGIGLGLSIAKGIMDAHGSRLWVESRLGEGTTFHFVLGRVLPEVATAPDSRDRRRSTSVAV